MNSSAAGGKELLSDFGDAETCLGLIVDNQHNSAIATQVQEVREGSPAAVAGVRVGDSVLQVDGVAVRADNAGRLLKPPRASIGSTCVVVFSRQGKSFECKLSRSSLARVQMTQRLMDLIRTATDLTSQMEWSEGQKIMGVMEQLNQHAQVKEIWCNSNRRAVCNPQDNSPTRNHHKIQKRSTQTDFVWAHGGERL